MYRFDREFYLNQYGFIKDKKTAIELLCLTDKIWTIIDPELRNDPDVMLFYQPIGIKVVHEEQDAGVTLTNVTVYADSLFRKPYYHEFRDVFVPSECLVPDIDRFPVGFDYDKYFQIQREMMNGAKRVMSVQEGHYGPFTSEIVTNTDDNVHSPDEAGIFIFDREILKRYAAEYLESRQP